MTRQTEYHDWTIPTEGETTNWDVILNTFFEDELDIDVILAAPEADRPPAGPDAPTLFFATDAGRLDFNDGTLWHDNVVGSGVLTEDDGTQIAASASALNFGSNLDASNDGTGRITIDATVSGSYTDSDAEDAINNDVDHGSTAPHNYLQPSDVDSSNWDDYEIQKDGTDGTGVINFKTT